MMRKIFGVLLTAIAVMVLWSAANAYNASVHLEGELRKMHTLALQHRSYMPSDRWKHEEKQLQVDEGSIRAEAITKAAGGAVLLIIGILARGGSGFQVPWWLRALRPRQAERNPLPAQPAYNARPMPSPARLYVPTPDPEHEDPCAWHADADRIAKIRTNEEPKRWLSKTERAGKFGERDAWRAIQPLIQTEGWSFIARNLTFTYDDGEEQKVGDVDLVLISPNDILYTIDAKNWYQYQVSYEWHRENTKLNKVWFEDRWSGTGGKEFYPAIRAVTLMRLTRATLKKAGFQVADDEPFMAFSKSMIVPKETRIYALNCVKMTNLAQRLRDVDATHANINRREEPEEPNERAISPLILEHVEPEPDPMEYQKEPPEAHEEAS